MFTLLSFYKVLGFELRSSCLYGRHFDIWDTVQSLLYVMSAVFSLNVTSSSIILMTSYSILSSYPFRMFHREMYYVEVLHLCFQHFFFFTNFRKTIVLLCFLLLWQTPWPKSTSGRKFSYHLTAYRASWNKVRVETQVNNLGAGTEAETIEECCFLACFPWIA